MAWEWKTDQEEVACWVEKAKKAEVSCLGHSAGGREIMLFAYGEAEKQQVKANYGAACGGLDAKCYVDRSHKKPVVLLVGAVHGQETEGVAALMHLLSLLETGKDLNGEANDALLEAVSRVRLLIVPLANPDGRARMKPQTIVGMTNDELRYWGQGTWKDGSLCGWPECKKVHPILEHAGFLGGYFNDDGVNLMHDQFFKPMAKETSILLELMEAEQVDCVLQLHGGSNSMNALLQTAYVPLEINEAIAELQKRCNEVGELQGLPFSPTRIPGKESGETPPSFNLASAMHHVNGAISAVFESNECIIDYPGPKQTREEIIRGHMILFEETCRMMAERQGQ